MSNRYQDAERAIIAHLLTEPDTVPRVSSRLVPEDFSSELYREAFEAILDLSKDSRSIDVITLKSRGVEFPLGFLDILNAADDIEPLLDIVEEGGFRARVTKHAEVLKRMAYSSEREDIVTELARFDRLGVDTPTMFDHSRAVELYAESLHRRKTHGAGLPWGYHDLDDTIQPATGGDMIVIAARPSVGKTALAENLADNWSYEAAYPVLFVSAEMRLSQLMDRAVSRITDIPAQTLLRGILGPTDEQKVAEALKTREQFNIFYMDDGRATCASTRSAAQSVRLQYGGLTGIIVDYIQLLADPGDNEYSRVTRISRALKSLAREFDVPLLALSQLSRTGQYRKDSRPRLEDIRDSGAIEQDADIVFGLFAPSNAELECNVLKNRQGSQGTVYFDFDKDHVRITGQ